MIQQFRVTNLRVLRSAEIILTPLTILVGPNGSGKSSVLLAVELLGRGVHGHVREVLQGRLHPSSLRTAQVAGPLSIETIGPADTWRLRLLADPEERSSPPSIEWKSGPADDWVGSDTLSREQEKSRNQAFPEVLPLRLQGAALGEPSSFVPGEEPRLMPSGENLAAVLAYLKLVEPDVFHQVEEALRQVVPAVRRIRHDTEKAPAPPEPPGMPGLDAWDRRRPPATRYRLLFDTQTGTGIPAWAMSEGTLRTLALLTGILSMRRPAIVLLDDIEKALHPRAISLFMSQIRGLLTSIDGLQILATTHSPYLLDECDPEEVRLLWPDDDGYATCQPMEAHPDFARWRAYMSAGEMWSVLGLPWRGGDPQEGEE